MAKSLMNPVCVGLQAEPLDLLEAAEFIRHETAGAVNIFTGTTRNHHDGKTVRELYYDCYQEMALSELRNIAERMLGRYELTRIYLSHRTGRVPIGETSIILAISGAHRKDVFDATAEAMNLIKQDVPIWKKETYEYGALWKEELLVKGHPDKSGRK